VLLAVRPAHPESPALQVHLADGTSLQLRSWTFSYEYQAFRRGEGALLRDRARRETNDLWLGKKVLPLGTQTLELLYVEEMRIVEGEPTKVPVARALVLVSAAGKRNKEKAEPPHPDLLLPDAGGRIVQARALDLRGETLGGTKREFCLLSYSSLVECPGAADQRVVKLQLQP
jgi:hypothetical protein